MDKNFNSWVITGVVIAFLILFVIVSGNTYFSELKGQITKAEEKSAELQKQLGEKNQEITAKSESINNLNTQNSGLTSDLEEKRKEVEAKSKEVEQKLAQIKKLQGSVKTVGRCLLGTLGVFEAIKQNDGDLARKSALLIEATCQESGKIIGEVERF